MQRIAALNSRCVYREKSSITGDLVEAMAKATTEFAPLQFDQTGVDEDGREYRYASLAAINKATKKALADNGLWLHCDYGFDEAGIYAVVVLEHKTGQFVSSTLPVGNYASIHRQKAAMTLTRRAAIEGLLGLCAEADDDAQQCRPEDLAAEQEEDPKAAQRIEMALNAISIAPNEERLAEILDRVDQKIARGMMPAASKKVLDEAADVRRSELLATQEAVS